VPSGENEIDVTGSEWHLIDREDSSVIDRKNLPVAIDQTRTIPSSDPNATSDLSLGENAIELENPLSVHKHSPVVVDQNCTIFSLDDVDIRVSQSGEYVAEIFWPMVTPLAPEYSLVADQS
jgi:hypothetical protein